MQIDSKIGCYFLLYYINKLRKMGLLCREGTKGGKWVLRSIED